MVILSLERLPAVLSAVASAKAEALVTDAPKRYGDGARKRE